MHNIVSYLAVLNLVWGDFQKNELALPGAKESRLWVLFALVGAGG